MLKGGIYGYLIKKDGGIVVNCDLLLYICGVINQFTYLKHTFMKFFLVLAAIVTTVIALCMSTANNYSPMDTYTKAVVKEAQDSARHANEVTEYLNR